MIVDVCALVVDECCVALMQSPEFRFRLVLLERGNLLLRSSRYLLEAEVNGTRFAARMPSPACRTFVTTQFPPAE
jgi:hypothetical protein